MGARTLEKCKTYYEGRVFKTNKWKDQIDPRVYDALVSYQVEITD